MLTIERDTNGSPYVEWCQGTDDQNVRHIKRAWVQRRTGVNDWARVGRYLHVARMGKDAPLPSPDFPVHSTLPDEQVLLAFVYSLNAITGLAWS